MCADQQLFYFCFCFSPPAIQRQRNVKCVMSPYGVHCAPLTSPLLNNSLCAVLSVDSSSLLPLRSESDAHASKMSKPLQPTTTQQQQAHQQGVNASPARVLSMPAGQHLTIPSTGTGVPTQQGGRSQSNSPQVSPQVSPTVNHSAQPIGGAPTSAGSNGTSAPAPGKSLRKVGKYKLGKTLGQGTFGKVKAAIDTETGKHFAIKMMDKAKIRANNMGEQIKKEISIMKMIRHESVIQLIEVLASASTIFVVMELVTGGERTGTQCTMLGTTRTSIHVLCSAV